MASLGGLFDFENFFSKEFLKDLWKNPTKLIFGVDPLGVEIGNLLLGKDDKSLINFLGSPSDDIQAQARAQGIDTGLANTLHDTGDLVASYYGGQGAIEGLNNIGGGGAGDFLSRMQGLPDGSGNFGGGLPLTAPRQGETLEEKVRRQQAEELMRQALMLANKKQGLGSGRL